MDKREIVIYISGPYSGNIDANIQKARELAIKTWEAGYMVFTPHLNTFHFERDCKCAYEDYINGDIEMVNRCNAMLMTDNWKDSKGAITEHDYAKGYGIPVFYSLKEMEDHYAKNQGD